VAKRVASAVTPQSRKAAPAPSPPRPKIRRAARAAAPAPQIMGMQLYTAEGARKYLTAAERDAFLAQ